MSHHKETLPDKIKNHLNKINKIVYEKNKKGEREKGTSSSSSGQISVHQPHQNNRQQPSNYLSPIKECPGRKQRPMSCNYVNNIKHKIN